MTTYGVTDQGFILKRLADIKNDLASALGTITDPVSGETLTPDLANEDDPLIQIVNSFSDTLAVAWEQLQLCYNQFDPSKATGVALSGLVQLNGLRRLAGTRSSVEVTITGTPGLILPAGKRITTMADTPIFELPAITINIGGTVTVTATCIEDGPYEAEAASIVKIVTPVSGWTSVVNSSAATIGTAEETDTSLRLRQKASTSQTAQSSIEAIAAGIGNLDGVSYVKVYQNITLLEDERTIPAKSIAPVVVGGDDVEIAQVLFEKIAAGGCQTYGDESVTLVDSLGVTYAMKFTRPLETAIYVEVEISIINTDVFPSDGGDQIKDAIVAWATIGASALNITSGYDRDGYLPGQSVYASELYVPVYSIPGLRILSITISTDDSSLLDDSTPSDGSAIEIDWNEIAIFSTSNINITVT